MLLSTPTPGSSELHTITVVQGDPSWAGVGRYSSAEPAGLPSARTPGEGADAAAVYEEQIGFALFSLDSEALESAVRQVREGRA